ncbi:MAG: tRNA dihydrouridine synthase DusB [Bacteroidetes bacterium]|nr:tRNA dihydrouridine synthase DusB [Bacteroidota bacterium]
MVKIGAIELPDYPLILAPMENFTDLPFRLICREMGADLVISEFISSEGLIRLAKKSRQKMTMEANEHPVGIQIVGHDEEHMKEAVVLATEAGPDLIDLNFGCPARKVVSKGSGAALLADIDKMVRIAATVVRATTLPVTAKTRLGWDEQNKNILEIALRLQDAGIRALSIHGRTKVQAYKGRADWTLIAEVRNHPAIHIPVFGNGDITDVFSAGEIRKKYAVDGMMIGRGAVGNPWIFREIKHYFSTGEMLPSPTIPARLAILNRHIEMAVALKGEMKALLEMRKFYTGYFKGIAGIKLYRAKLVTAGNWDEVNQILGEISGMAPADDRLKQDKQI